MSRHDFELCTIREFDAVCKAWAERREGDHREQWERFRALAFITIQPHIAKSSLTPQKLLPFPWDETPSRERVESKKLTAEEQRQRFEALANKLKDQK